jgi:hypothetical protein
MAEVRLRFRTWVECWYLEYARREGKARWGATTHTLLDWGVNIVDNLFDETPVYIMLVRHPLDVAVSAIEKFDARLFSLEAVSRRLRYWVEVVTQHLSAGRQLSRRFTCVRYEDLVKDPTVTINALFAFLGERPVPDVATQMFTKSHRGHWGDNKILATQSVDTASVGRWRATLDRVMVDHAMAQEPRVAELMMQLDYTINW